jgi:hypothetical protein
MYEAFFIAAIVLLAIVVVMVARKVDSVGDELIKAATELGSLGAAVASLQLQVVELRQEADMRKPFGPIVRPNKASNLYNCSNMAHNQE